MASERALSSNDILFAWVDAWCRFTFLKFLQSETVLPFSPLKLILWPNYCYTSKMTQYFMSIETHFNWKLLLARCCWGREMPAVINNSMVKFKGMWGTKKTDKLPKTLSYHICGCRGIGEGLCSVQFFNHFLFWLFSKGLCGSNWSVTVTNSPTLHGIASAAFLTCNM